MNKTIHRITSLILACALLFGKNIHTQAAGSIYYVSPTGNDSNPGTASAPFKTFAKANSLLTAGSTLNIYAGTYTEQLKISKSGTSSAWITVKPLSGNVVIDMKNAAAFGLSLAASYISVNSLEVKNSGDICVNMVGNNLTVDGLVVHDCASHGIQTNNSSQIKILNSRVYRTVLSNASRSISSGWGSGIKVRLSDNVLIQGNIVYHNYGEGMGTRGTNVTIRANTVYDNFSVNIYTNSENATIERNFVYCTPNSGYERDGLPAVGIGMAEEYFDGWGARLKNAKVLNNIVAFCKHGIRYSGADDRLTGGGLKDATLAYNTLYGSTNSALSIVYESAQAGSLIANNIIWQAQDKLSTIDNPAGLTFKNNLWKVLPASAIRSSGDKIGDPKFASTPGYTPESYRPSSSSPAAGSAIDIGIANDFFAKSRGPSFDIGAIQFSGSSPNSIPQATATSTPATVQTTASPLPATSAPTNTQLPASPQPTATLIPPTLQPTNTFASTMTASLPPPTLVASPTAIPPTAFPTQTSLPVNTPTATIMPTNTTSASTLTTIPIADSYANSSSPATNYGTATTFRVDGSPIVRSYLRFEVQGINSRVSRATLRIFANSAASAGVAANSVSDNGWTESTVNYNNAPAIGNALGSSGPVSAGIWISMDVTTYITGNGTYNLALTTPGSTAISLASRESGANAPQLVIQTSP
jgi:parallel beta helix pectate lyase-like protein/pectate lyase-like protein